MATWVDARTLQKALVHFGALPANQIDGDIGPITREALATWLNNGASARVSASVLASYTTQPSADGRSMLIDPDALVQVIEQAAAAYGQRAKTVRRPASSSAAPAGNNTSTALSAPFFRRDNPWMWGAMAVLAAGLGGLFYYGKKKRWFR